MAKHSSGKPFSCAIPAVLALLCLVNATPMADTILLKDGTELKGKVTGFEKGQFLIEGGGRSRIPIGDVRSILEGDEEVSQEIADATNMVRIAWGKREVLVTSHEPVLFKEVGLVPRIPGYYTGQRQFLGGRLLLDSDAHYAEVTLKVRLLDKDNRLIDQPQLILFDVPPNTLVPFLIDLQQRNPARVASMDVSLVTFRTRGVMSPKAGRGKRIPSIYLDPKNVKEVEEVDTAEPSP